MNGRRIGILTMCAAPLVAAILLIVQMAVYAQGDPSRTR